MAGYEFEGKAEPVWAGPCTSIQRDGAFFLSWSALQFQYCICMSGTSHVHLLQPNWLAGVLFLRSRHFLLFSRIITPMEELKKSIDRFYRMIHK
jgi:hypothetical protein